MDYDATNKLVNGVVEAFNQAIFTVVSQRVVEVI